MLEQGFKTQKELDETVINFLWLPSHLLPADVASKSQQNFTAPDIWNHGPDFYRANEQLIMSHRYAHYKNNKFYRDTNFNLGHKTILPADKGLTPEIQINQRFFYTSYFTTELKKAQSLGMHTSTYTTLQTSLPTLWDETPAEITCLSKEFYLSLLDKSNNYYYLIGVLSKLLSYTKYAKGERPKWEHSSIKWAAKAHQTMILSSQVHTEYHIPQTYKTVKINNITCVISDFREY